MNISDFYKKEQSNIFYHLDELIKYKSYSEDVKCCKNALLYVLNLAKSFGLTTKLGRYSDVGTVEIGEGSESVGILVHVDVVDEGTLDLWDTDPFKLVIKDDNLYGRGVVDDKGPVIACLYALKYIKDLQIPLHRKIMLIIGTTEEIEWTDMEHFKEEFPLPDYGFSPDGNFPVFNRENGYMDVELIFHEKDLTGEENFSGGASLNSVPSNASYYKNGEKVEFIGRGAHSSTPELGINAINLMAKSLVECGENFNFAHFIDKYFPENCYESRLKFRKNDGTVSAKGDLTIVPTFMTQKHKNVIVNFNIRQSFSISGQAILDELSAFKDIYGYDINVVENLEPISVDEILPWLVRMCQLTKRYGMDDKCQLATGCSYAKSIPNFVSWGPVFPDEPDCAHMENEMQPLASFIKSAIMYTEYLVGEVK